jgi:hypothetical protein
MEQAQGWFHPLDNSKTLVVMDFTKWHYMQCIDHYSTTAGQ